ncbi:MAG: hypothetical protein EXQ92_00895 [Alphaproteobacteria bacterium]|nr:hypothetical protein [Alphaproteobacteria bacterium]
MERRTGKADINQLVSALERQATEILSFVGRTEDGNPGTLYRTKEQFRERVSVFESLLLTAEAKLDDIGRDKRDRLRRQIDELALFVLSKSVHSNIEYCRFVQSDEVMPLWARDMFQRDVGVLEDARERLTQPKYADRVRREDLDNIETMIRILKDLIAKAPTMPEFRPQRYANEHYEKVVLG